MSDTNPPFTFNITLSVLNHLGRNLYRSFVTVLGEAISNSWDAEAENIWIEIDINNDFFVIKDDGIGMSQTDFQDKFLTIGYSKREYGTKSPNKQRPYIGRKGIGKLALLSCAKKISIISKTKGGNYIGGVIDNSSLDDAIKNDKRADQYSLQNINHNLVDKYKENHQQGTIIYFEDVHDGIKNRLEHLRKIVALYFKFSLFDSFNIYINGKIVNEKDLTTLSNNTQFLWTINGFEDDNYLKILNNLKEQKDIPSEHPIKGFIASTKLPSQLNIRGVEEKIGIDVFVNGRLREVNILRHLPAFASRHISSYLYGQIHLDYLDDGTKKDKFTSSRDGIKDGDTEYKEFLELLKTDTLEKISNYWDRFRIKIISDKKETTYPEFNNFKEDKTKAINTFIKAKSSSDLKEKGMELVKSLSPQKSYHNKKILISHAKPNKIQADIIYNLLMFYDFMADEILYTSSEVTNSRIPVDTDVLDYIRDFFIQDWYSNPHVFFIVSKELEKSWFASLEVGAAWVTNKEHYMATISNIEPKQPLNPDNHIYIAFDNNNNCDKNDLYQIFEDLAQKHNKKTKNIDAFKSKVSELTNPTN